MSNTVKMSFFDDAWRYIVTSKLISEANLACFSKMYYQDRPTVCVKKWGKYIDLDFLKLSKENCRLFCLGHGVYVHTSCRLTFFG